MSAILDSKSLIKTIKRRAFIPTSQETFTSEDFLEMATEEINLNMMDQLIIARGDYLVQFKDTPLEREVFKYAIPDRAVGNKLRDAFIIDEKGNVVYELAQISLEELNEFEGPWTLQTRNTFYIQNNDIVLTTQALNPGYKIRMYFYIRPNKLVINERSTPIQTITEIGDTVEIGFSFTPKHFTSALQYDIVGAKSPNKIKFYDLTPVSINLNTGTVTFSKAAVTDDNGKVSINIGDFLTQAEETVVPNIPTELHPIIAQRVAIACLEAMGDENNKQSAERKLAQMEKAALRMISNRVEGAPKKIRQRHGTLNMGLNNRRSNGDW
jgi:hypothetical protein